MEETWFSLVSGLSFFSQTCNFAIPFGHFYCRSLALLVDKIREKLAYSNSFSWRLGN